MSPPPPIFYCSIRRKVIKFSKFPAAAVHWHHELSYLHKELLESRGTLFLSQMYLFFCDNRLCRLDLIELVCHSTLWQFMIPRWKFLAKLHTFLVHCSLLWRESHLVIWLYGQIVRFNFYIKQQYVIYAWQSHYFRQQLYLCGSTLYFKNIIKCVIKCPCILVGRKLQKKFMRAH